MFTYDAIRGRITAGTIQAPPRPRPDRNGEARVNRHRLDFGSLGDRLQRMCTALQSRHDASVRRAIAERHERLAHNREVGGEFSVLP